MSSIDNELPDIASSLNQLGTTTTAAELVRKQGQTKKVKVISEKKLMEWIMALLRQHMAGKADAFSDAEKEELLRKTQEELAKRILREQNSETERSRVQGELEKAMGVLSNAQASQSDLDDAIAALRTQLAEAENAKADLQQDNYDLQDQLNEKISLLSSTLAEKEKLRDTVRSQMVRMSALVEGVIGIDNQYYGSRHQEQNPVAEDAEGEEQFYHDFDVGAKVIATLGLDLERLRGIAAAAAEMANDPRSNLLEGDLALLEQLKDGSLAAIDVAQPVAGLIEALDGARSAGEALEDAVVRATGNTAQRHQFTAVPDADGVPAEVLAGATTVVRELGAELVRTRDRIGALKQIADESDADRMTLETELEQVRAAYDDVLSTLETRAAVDELEIPASLADRQANPAARSQAAALLLEQMGAASNANAHGENLAAVNRILGRNTAAVAGKEAAANVRHAITALEELVLKQRQELKAAADREARLAEQVGQLARATKSNVTPDADDQRLDVGLAKLDRALAAGNDDAEILAEASAEVIRSLEARTQAEQQVLLAEHNRHERELADLRAEQASQTQAERMLARTLLTAAHGDEPLALATADLALELDEPTLSPQFSDHLYQAVNALAERKQALAAARATADESVLRANARSERLEADLAELRGELAKLRAELEAKASAERELAARVARAAADDGPTTGAYRKSGEKSGERTAIAKGGSGAFARVNAVDEALAQLTARKQALIAESQQLTAQVREREAQVRDRDSELARAKGDVNEARAQLAAANKRLDERAKGERALATELVRAAVRDPQLADAAADLALALESVGPDEHLPVDVHAHALTSVTMLAERKRALDEDAGRRAHELATVRNELAEANDQVATISLERDEMALSGKEVIAALSQQRETREQELKALRHENEQAAAKLADLESRTTQAEQANRTLAEALNKLAALEAGDSVDHHRVDLEVALSQLPAEGETDVVVPKDIALQLADGGARVAEALMARHRTAAAGLISAKQEQLKLGHELDRMRSDLHANRTDLDERDANLRRARIEVEAVRRELTDQGHSLAAKTQELSNTRGELATTRADLAVVEERLNDLGTKLKTVEAVFETTKRDLEWAKGERARAETRATAAAENQIQMAQALRQLGGVERGIDTAAVNDPVVKAAQKLEIARQAGGDELTSAGRELVQAVSERVRNLTTDLDQARGRASEAKTLSDRQATELANLRGAVVDREHSLANLSNELERARGDLAGLGQQATALRAELSNTKTGLSATQEELRQAQAELEEHHARNAASANHRSDDVQSLRAQLSGSEARHSELQTRLTELAQATEASEARLRRQRDEFTRRLEERDQVIHEKDALLDELSARSTDTKGLQAQVEALTEQLANSNRQIAELSGQHGERAGSAMRSTDLVREVQKAHAERDRLREEKRTIEGELTEAVSHADALRSQVEERRKEVQTVRDQAAQDQAGERAKGEELKEEFRKLKEEVIGLRARLRRLTEGKAS